MTTPSGPPRTPPYWSPAAIHAAFAVAAEAEKNRQATPDPFDPWVIRERCEYCRDPQANVWSCTCPHTWCALYYCPARGGGPLPYVNPRVPVFGTNPGDVNN